LTTRYMQEHNPNSDERFSNEGGRAESPQKR
jgi:hypothetical protein